MIYQILFYSTKSIHKSLNYLQEYYLSHSNPFIFSYLYKTVIFDTIPTTQQKIYLTNHYGFLSNSLFLRHGKKNNKQNYF
jgi:hypothetical protein